MLDRPNNRYPGKEYKKKFPVLMSSFHRRPSDLFHMVQKSLGF
jgi:hypothetical protein